MSFPALLPQVVDFLGDRDSCQVLTLTLPFSDLSDHFHPVEGLGQAIDLQVTHRLLSLLPDFLTT